MHNKRPTLYTSFQGLQGRGQIRDVTWRLRRGVKLEEAHDTRLEDTKNRQLQTVKYRRRKKKISNEQTKPHGWRGSLPGEPWMGGR